MCYQAKGLNAQPKQADPFVFASSFLQAVEMVDTSITGVNVDTLPSKRNRVQLLEGRTKQKVNYRWESSEATVDLLGHKKGEATCPFSKKVELKTYLLSPQCLTLNVCHYLDDDDNRGMQGGYQLRIYLFFCSLNLMSCCWWWGLGHLCENLCLHQSHGSPWSSGALASRTVCSSAAPSSGNSLWDQPPPPGG